MMADKEAKIVLTAQDKTKQAFDQVKNSFSTLAARAGAANANFAALGAVLGSAFSVGAFTEFVKSTTEGLAKLKDLKDATGSSISNLSALEDVALRTGNSFETVSDALLKLNKGLTAAKPDSDLAAVLRALGLSVKELKAQDPAEALLTVAHAMDQFADDGDKARAAQILFGKSLAEVAPFLKDLAEKTKLVGTVTEKAVEEAKKFSDTMAEAHKNSIDLARTLVGPLLESLNATVKLFKDGKEAGQSFYETLTKEQLKLLGRLVPDEIKDRASQIMAALRDPQAALSSGVAGQINSLFTQGRKLQEVQSKIANFHPADNYGDRAKPSLVVADPEAQKAFDDFMRKLKERGAAEQQQIALGRDLTDAEKYRVQILAELGDAHSKLDSKQKAVATAEALRVVGLIRFREEHEKATKAMLENSAAAQQSIAAILREGDARKQANKTLAEQIDEIGVSNDRLEEVRISRLEVAKATEEMALEQARAAEASEAEISALQRNIDLLERQIDLRRIAKQASEREANDPQRGAERALEDYVETAKKAGDATEALTKKTAQGLEDGLTAALTGGKFEVKNFVNEILAEIVRLQIVRPMLASIFAGGQSGGGVDWASIIGGVVSGAAGKAVGGPVSGGTTYLVGERGPELFVPSTAGKIVPNNALGGGSPTIVQTNYIDSSTDQANLAQIAATAATQAVRQYDAARRAQGAPV